MDGLAGIGKTELAIQAARTALDRGWFPGGVLFVDIFGYDPARSLDPGQALEGFLRALAIPSEHILAHTRDRARLYTSVLTAYAREGRRILVVIDNVATHEQAKPLLPAESTSAAIVTSRNTLGMLGARLLDLDISPTTRRTCSTGRYGWAGPPTLASLTIPVMRLASRGCVEGCHWRCESLRRC